MIRNLVMNVDIAGCEKGTPLSYDEYYYAPKGIGIWHIKIHPQDVDTFINAGIIKETALYSDSDMINFVLEFCPTYDKDCISKKLQNYKTSHGII